MTNSCINLHKKVWFDENIGKFNFDERGILLGRFEVDDKVLVVYKTGEYEIASLDLNRRFNFSDIEIFTKFNNDTISCLHYIGNKKSYYLKRFKIETNQPNKLFSFIDDSRGSKFIKATINANPSLDFKYRLKNGDKKEKNIDIIDFIDIKGWKASGNKIPSFLRMSGFLFLDGESEIEDEEIIDNHTQPAINEDSTNDDLTLF